jgi:hypothetical protein
MSIFAIVPQSEKVNKEKTPPPYKGNVPNKS